MVGLEKLESVGRGMTIMEDIDSCTISESSCFWDQGDHEAWLQLQNPVNDEGIREAGDGRIPTFGGGVGWGMVLAHWPDECEQIEEADRVRRSTPSVNGNRITAGVGPVVL